MTLIALTCQNRREITAHAGQCRNFLIVEVQDGRIGEPRLLELPREACLHEAAGDQPHPLDAVDWLVSGSMGAGLRRRLAQRGVQTRLTTERDPMRAVQRLLCGDLPDEAAPNEHGAGSAHESGHDGCSHCNCGGGHHRHA
jgi:predicted Fe-Mo cluster-binding NifX family protein